MKKAILFALIAALAAASLCACAPDGESDGTTAPSDAVTDAQPGAADDSDAAPAATDEYAAPDTESAPGSADAWVTPDTDFEPTDSGTAEDTWYDFSGGTVVLPIIPLP